MPPENPPTCAFCGTAGKPTGEHVFGDWLSGIGLSAEPSPHGAGPLNRSLRDLGTTPPFRRTVRDVCGPCNHGWMSTLEVTAKRVLTPLILGQPGVISADDFAAIAAWTQKTVLVAMLMSSNEDRARGYGLPSTEYRSLYAARAAAEPTPTSRFWIGRYLGGQRIVSAWATPIVVRVEGLPEPELPHGYAMNVIVGNVLLHGIRFTSQQLELDVEPAEGFAKLWPPSPDQELRWPQGTDVDDEAFVTVSLGRNLRVRQPALTLRPWKPAADLPTSEEDGEDVRVPTPCGQHFVRYPRALVAEAQCGVFYAFVTECECEKAYLMQTESDGAHFKMEAVSDARAALLKRYEEAAGDEFIVRDSRGDFVCKRIPRRAPRRQQP